MSQPIQIAGWTLADNLEGNHFENVALSLVDLHRTRLRRNENILTGVTFIGCRIEGPAIMLVVSGCKFDTVSFGATKGMDTLVLRPASKTGVVGAIPVKDCTFKGCEMFGVGFTGDESFLEQLLALKGGDQ